MARGKIGLPSKLAPGSTHQERANCRLPGGQLEPRGSRDGRVRVQRLCCACGSPPRDVRDRRVNCNSRECGHSGSQPPYRRTPRIAASRGGAGQNPPVAQRPPAPRNPGEGPGRSRPKRPKGLLFLLCLPRTGPTFTTKAPAGEAGFARGHIRYAAHTRQTFALRTRGARRPGEGPTRPASAGEHPRRGSGNTVAGGPRGSPGRGGYGRPPHFLPGNFSYGKPSGRNEFQPAARHLFPSLLRLPPKGRQSWSKRILPFRA